MRCPDRDILQRFVLGQLPPVEVETLAEHVEGCVRCVEVLHAVHDRDALVGVMTALPAEPPEPATDLLDKFYALRTPSYPGTTGGHVGNHLGLLAQLAEPAAEITQELYDFLAPPQEAGDLGRLGAYRVLRVLGAGGMGVVFEAEDPDLKRRVALKVLRPALATSASARRRFLREGQAAAALHNDLIVPIYQVGEDRGLPYLAMPLLRGETLEDRLRREAPLPTAVVLRIGREIAEGLAAAHAHGLIHRDVKPSNIWLESELGASAIGGSGRVKLLDFGLARAVGGDAHLTQSGVVVGTPAYMAPEQARSEAVDQRSDLFSLGCVLYRAATGQVPFPGRNALDTLLALAQHNPAPPSKLSPRLPRALSDLIMKLLARQPDSRYPTAQAVVEALDAVAAGRPPAGHRPHSRIRTVLGAAMLLATVALVGYWLRPGGPPPNDAPEAPGEFFAPAVQFSAGLYPNAVAVADFNRDGKTDLVISNLQSRSVGVMLGNGDGTFRPPASSPAGDFFAQAITVADLDGDGRLDLVVGDFASAVSVLIGKGDGTFLPPMSYTVGTHPVSAAVADLDGDGKPDLAVSISEGVGVLLGRGDGTFHGAVKYPDGKQGRKVVVADFDGDGKPDLAVQDDSDVCVLIGNGDGTFRPGVIYSANKGCYDLAVADLNGDGKPDLIFAGGKGAGVLLGNGDGTFREAVPYPSNTTYVAVTVADLDGDGLPDLALVNQAGGRVDMALSNGDGTFREALTYAVGREPAGIAVGDFNGDGALDLTVVNRNTNNVSVLLHRPPPAYQAHLGPAAFVPAGTEPRAVVAVDLDRDSTDDLIVADYAGRALHVLRGKGDGNFESVGRYEAGKGPVALAAGDFDRDGRTDVAVIDSPGSAVLVYRGKEGALAAPIAYSAGKKPVAVAVGDLDRDGKPDMVVADYDSGAVSVFLGRGDGAFRDAMSFRAGDRPRSVVVVDVNGDGKSDLVVTNRFQAGTVSVLLGKGDGAFAMPVSYPVGAYPIAVATGDFNGDGKIDIAVANWGGADLNVLLGKGDGTFDTAVNYGTGPGNPLALAAVDVDGDGKLDLVVSGGVDHDWVSVLLGKSDGTFSSTLHLYSTGLHPLGLAVGRFRRGGRPDVVTANAHSGNVSVLLNRRAEPYLRASCTIESVDPDGMTCSLVVEAHKAGATWRDMDAGYTGTVRVRSSDPHAALPEDYQFKPTDSGGHILRVVLRTPGNQTLTVTDTEGRMLPSSVAIRVLRPADLHYFLEGPDSVEAGQPFSVTVHIKNPFNTWTNGYGGTIKFESNDPAARLPANHTFNRGGVHTFTNAFTLATPGDWKITVTDTAFPQLTATATVTVRAAKGTGSR